MWLKLLSKQQSIGEMLKPTLINGRWRKPTLQGKQKAELRTYFEKAGVPWIYEKETPVVHEGSAYNIKPKKQLLGDLDSSFEVRIATIRRALAGQDERLLKLRQERIANKPWVGQDKILVAVLKALQASETEAKKASTKQSAAAQKAAEIAELKEMGIDGFSKKTGSKSGMTSKGGSIGKKEREVLNLAKGGFGEGALGGAGDVEKAPEKGKK